MASSTSTWQPKEDVASPRMNKRQFFLDDVDHLASDKEVDSNEIVRW